MIVKKKLILASASPRRKALMEQIGLQFEIRESGVDENVPFAGNPEEYVASLSKQKATAVAMNVDNAIVIGADTTVIINNEMLAKPATHEEAMKMLKTLSGRMHKVYTGFTLFDRPSNKSVSATEVTSVKFRTLDEDEISAYVQSGSPMDKAGAYGIQDDYGAVFVERVEGCFYNVMGFPLARFYQTLKAFQEQLGI